MNNYQWLLQMDGADRKAWFDAEHVETEERALDGDTEPENEDSREQLESDVFKAADDMEMFYNGERFIDTRKIIGWLDRQAAITEREVEHDLMKAGRMAVEVERERIKKLTAERDELQAQLCELTADCDMLENERDNLEAKCDGWKKHVMAIENAYSEALQWRDEYRSKFGKCIDYADAIHALMDDEGMA